MKKLFTALALIASVQGAHAAPVDFTSFADGIWSPTEGYTIGTADVDWAVKAYDGSTFTITTAGSKPEGYSQTFRNGIVEYEDNDSWLRSPALHMVAGNRYIVKFQYRFQSCYDAGLKAWISATDPTVNIVKRNEVKQTSAFFTDTELPSTWKNVEYEFVPEENGDYFISFNVTADSMNEGGILFIGATSVQEISTAVKPLAPTGLTATADPDGNLSVSLTWNLPTADTSGGSLAGDNAITGIRVYRDDALAATLDGTPTEWTDTEATGLANGPHSYRVSALTANAESAKSESADVEYVGLFQYAPDEMTFGPWEKYTGSGVGFTEHKSSLPEGQKSYASIWSYNPVEDENAWLISPELALEPGKTYRLKFKYLLWPEINVEHFDVYKSTDIPSAATEAAICALDPLLSLDNLSNTASGYVWEDASIDGITGDGPVRILFHVSGSYCKRFGVASFVFEEYKADAPFEPAAPSALTAVQGNGLEVTLNWTLPAESTDGTTFGEGVTASSVKIWRDGSELATIDNAAVSYTDTEVTGLTYGAHTYSVQALVNGVWSALSEEAAVEVIDRNAPQSLPWAPQLYNLDDESFAAEWSTFYGENHGYASGTWIARPAGLFLNNQNGGTEDAWLISLPLMLENGKTYSLEYTITSNNAGIVALGLVEGKQPADFSQAIVGQYAAPTDGNKETMAVSFIYTDPAPNAVQQKQLEPGAGGYPRLAIRACTPQSSVNHNFIVSNLKISEDNGPVGISNISDAAATCIEVYDLQGRKLGNAASTSLDGFGKGMYIVRYKSNGNVRTVKTVK